MASDNGLGFYLNQAQRIGHKDVTCMCCEHFQDIGIRYCNLADKENDLDTPAYDCPFFEYAEHSMPKESHASNSLDVVLDIVIGAVITIVLVHLINH